jgi:glycosyltransferase involved in cell wall biosynthesis
MYIWLTDFDMQGSGYRNISARLVNELILTHRMGVVVLGLHYRGEPHKWPFSVVPVAQFGQYPHHIKALYDGGYNIEGIICAFDIPFQIMTLRTFGNDIPVHSIFPIESGPLHMKWASSLALAASRLTLSQTGVDALAAYQIPATLLPLGVDEPDVWQPVNDDRRTEIRQRMGIEPGTFLIFTNADNQERKNLSDTFEIFSRFSVNIVERDEQTGYVTKTEERQKTHWILLTRPGNFMQGGHDLDDLAMRHGVSDRITILERGLPTQTVADLTAAADCVMMFPKAGGLEVPVLEAMACRTPVVGIWAHAVAEHLADGRGYDVGYRMAHMDVWGNGLRYYVDPFEAVTVLDYLSQYGPDQMIIDRAQKYVNNLNWQTAGQVLVDTIKGHHDTAKDEKTPDVEPKKVIG